jgi:hypothetical protein
MAVAPPFKRHKGAVEAKFSGAEIALLAQVAQQLRAVIQAEGHPPEARRLFPPAYPDDEEAEQEYEGMTRDELTSGKLESLELFEDSIASGREKRGAWSLTLDDEQAQAWLGVLNDARLTIGTRLDVTEETYEQEIAPDDPDRDAHELYIYLGWVEESLVDVLLG